MAVEQLPHEVWDIIDRIRVGYDPQRIIVFGSYARGTERSGSDLDLLVVKDTTARWADRVREVSRLVTPRRLPMDIIVKTPDEIEEALRERELFVRQIIEEGIVAYEREPASA
ncbi:MAG TPA: nucleotidyltransferase domain-containing protein [Armatimonadetes bacterium]|mgnify:CR=1 FL=1|nr:nucleotidyltransferase domain-containing protein [Armatimonadota bacterium]